MTRTNACSGDTTSGNYEAAVRGNSVATGSSRIFYVFS